MLTGAISDATLLLTLSAEAALTDLHAEERSLLRMQMNRAGGVWSGPYANGVIQTQSETVTKMRARFHGAALRAMDALEAESEARRGTEREWEASTLHRDDLSASSQEQPRG